MRAWLRWACGETPPPLAAFLLIIYATLAISTKSYAPVFSSGATLWRHAAARAPNKPRPLNNYGVMLVGQGRFAEARHLFLRAADAGRAMSQPRWDRVEGRAGALANLKALDQLSAQARQRAP